MSNSPLADQDEKYRATKGHYVSNRKLNGVEYKIDTITLHCAWGGQFQTLKALAACFQGGDAGASANYGIDGFGKIGLFVPEGYRSFCSSYPANDVRSVTVEMNSAQTWASEMTDATINAAINLSIDICKRNGIKKMHYYSASELGLNADRSTVPETAAEKAYNWEKIQAKRALLPADEGIFTLHFFFWKKPCPGTYLEGKMPWICQRVNTELEAFYKSKCNVEGKADITKILVENKNATTSDVKLLYVNGSKYVTFNNFENTEPTGATDYGKSSAYNNMTSTTMSCDNSYRFKSYMWCNKADKSDLSADASRYESGVYTEYIFPDCTYLFKTVCDYKYREGSYGYPNMNVYAKMISNSVYTGNYKDWVIVTPYNFGHPTQQECSITGYIGNQGSNFQFRPKFLVKKDNWSEVFDFGGLTVREDATVSYKGSYPIVKVYPFGSVLSKDNSDMQVSLKADKITALDKF